ncbi:hypothetical protein FQN54_000156 [Arachnomyces sp. PD_36]|nr:hypothetical protein FQN54_000156 [Arachnomyces sp. PD_36]
MDAVILTPRLKLIRVTTAERGSPELEWAHELCTDLKASWWSIKGQAKSIEDTENSLKRSLPSDEERYRAIYAVHMILDAPTSSSDEIEPQPSENGEKPTRFIGLVTLKSLDGGNLPLPEDLTLPAADAITTLITEIAYSFLPIGWGKGYATESLKAVLESCKKAKEFWAPFSKVFVRALVNEGNPASQRVMEKVGMEKKGVFHWSGKPVFIAGEWREEDRLYIYAMHLLE